MRKISIVSFTAKGAGLSEKVASVLKNDEACSIKQYEKTSHPSLSGAEQITVPLSDWCREVFGENDVILFIGAMGIAVRSIAPCVADKFTDPAVLVMDEMGKYMIPVLSGHVGGANEFATNLAKQLGAEPVITTATDLHQLFAVDVFAKKNDLVIADRQQAKNISAALLDGEKVYFYAGDNFMKIVDKAIQNGFVMCKTERAVTYNNPVEKGDSRQKIPSELIMLCEDEIIGDNNASARQHRLNEQNSINIIAVTTEKLDCLNKLENDQKINVCQLVPKCNVLGIGCRKGTDSNLLEQTILQTLEQQKISLKSIASIATIDIKKEEKAICEFSLKYQIPMEIFSAEELMQTEGNFTTSEFVLSQTGTDNVCERAAITCQNKLIPEACKKYEKADNQLHKKDRNAFDHIENQKYSNNPYIKMKKQAGNGITLAIASRDWSISFE